MASTPPKPLKQLGELLQEHQEPFVLEDHLIERGYQKNSLNSKGTFGCCSHRTSNKFLKRSASCGLIKSRKGIPHCTKILRTVCKKFVSTKEDQSMKSCDSRNEEYGVTEMGSDVQEIAESDRFSSASSNTVFNSCCESDREETSISLPTDRITFDEETSQALKICNTREKEVTDRTLRWRCMVDSQQLSPVSVLEVPSHEVQKNARIRQEENLTACPKKVLEDSLSSAPSRELLFHSAIEKSSCTGLQGLNESNPPSQFMKLKRVLQQTKKLLFDCVRDAVETHVRNERGQQQYKEFLGPEKLGMLICERIKSWGKQVGDKKKKNYLLDLDFMDSVEIWSDSEKQKREVEMEIGDAILEEIKNELVTEMIDFLEPTTCRTYFLI
ncbi:hypothetical protein ACB094_10G157500 [Castanea mollissima]